jgi:4-hydroxy-3-polyprenylbenzoate decarboxylase
MILADSPPEPIPAIRLGFPGLTRIIIQRVGFQQAEIWYFCSAIGTEAKMSTKVIIGISGASGAIYGIRLLERLRQREAAEIHLILTRSGEKTLFLETGKTAADLKKLADYSYPLEDISCRLASGSYPTDAMVIAPCSIHTMSAIANGISSNLMVRAADVVLKERRKLILMVRESPFHVGHLRNMTALAEMGAIIAPPIPGFYHNPQSVMDLVDHSVDRVLDLLGLPDATVRRWEGATR